MLGWALKRGFQGATGGNDASGAGEADTTQFEAPDTPAPVFAARAFKNAIFGAPKTLESTVTDHQKRVEPARNKRAVTPDVMVSPSKQSPSKQPTSILLTPGTGTARRKRVSFNHDVKAGSGVDSSPLSTVRQRKRTTLQQALENSRSANSKKSLETAEAGASLKATIEESEDEWEDDVCNHEMTVDLNEPHSESGKYWKAEFNRYRDEAMADIERMVKFKALAKSYAKKKDAEALDLAQKLKEEQLKVAQMEETVTSMTAHITDKRRRGSDREDATLMKDLAKQTTLAAQYRAQVKDLEALLQEHKGESTSNQSDRCRINTSPRTEQTILDVNRELRRARSELKQLDKLRKENEKLKANLSVSEQRVTKAREERSSRAGSDLLKMKKLEEYLRIAKEELRQKDDEIKKLKRDYETLKKDAKTRTAEAMQVLHEKNSKIAEFEKIIKALETANPSSKATRDLKSSIESLGKPSKYEGANPTRHLRRSVSVEEMTLDMTHKSLIGNSEEPSKQIKADSFFPSDWSDSLKDMKAQLRKEKKAQMEANKRERDSIMEDTDVSHEPIKKVNVPSLSFDSGRVMSTVLSNRLNKSPAKARTAKEILDEKLAEARAAARTEARAGDDAAEMHGALQKLAPRLSKSKPYSSRPLSSGSDGLGFDLVQDKFARLGSPEPERSSSMNTSRCALPADRQAAARARLEEKRLKRQRTGGARARDKENIKP